MSVDRSLQKFMSINRGIIIPSINTTGEASNQPTGNLIYVASDFGENAINNHSSNDAAHSERNQFIFNYVTRNFRNRCTSFQTYNNTFLGYNLLNPSNLLIKASAIDADIIYTPYVGAAGWMNSDYGGFVLPVGSHYDNNGQDSLVNNRHDITPNAQTFLQYSISVSSRRDTPSEFKGSTSYGFGMEFFEDCSPEGLDAQFPDKDIPVAMAWVTTNEDGTIVTSTQPNVIGYTNNLHAGSEVFVIFPDRTEIRIVAEILSNVSFRVTVGFTPIVTDATYYVFIGGTLGGYMWGQAESWAVPLVAGKLKVIKMSTGASWDVVRQAARATAKRNITNIPEIDNTNWDMYRGFGCIQINDAINYINKN